MKVLEFKHIKGRSFVMAPVRTLTVTYKNQYILQSKVILVIATPRNSQGQSYQHMASRCILHYAVQGFFCFAPPHPPPPPGNSSLASYFSSKILVFKIPSPSEFPMTFHGVDMDFSGVAHLENQLFIIQIIKQILKICR